MKRNSGFIFLVAAALVFAILFSDAPVFADSYTSPTYSVIIDTAPQVSLQASVEAALSAEGSGHTLADITHLTITSDVSYALTAADLAYVQTLPAMTHLFVADTVTVAGGSVGDNFFSFNLVIEDITFPMETIGNESFLTCTSLHTISLPKCTSIGNYVFFSCTALKNVSLPECLSCGNYAFADTNILETLTLPKMETVGEHFCYSCSSLKSISMPNALTFGSDAFKYTYLTNVNLPKAYSFGDYAFYSGYSLETIYLPSAKTFGDVAFNGCANLVAVDMPEATTFGTAAFSSSISLKNVSLPKCTSIGSSSFQSCVALESLNLPEIISVANYCFSSCFNLTSLYLPKATSIGSNLFDGNSKPITFYAPDAVPSFMWPYFSGFFRLGNSCLMVDRDSFSSYDNDPNDTTGTSGDSKWFGMPICIKNPLTPSPVPTATPTPAPTPAPTSAPTAAPTKSSGSSTKATQTLSPTAEPTATPAPTQSAAAEITAEPTVSEVPTEATPSPIAITASAMQLDGGRSKVTFDAGSLLAGTSGITLPNGETVSVDGASGETMTFEIESSYVAYGSIIEIVAMDSDNCPLCTYELTITSVLPASGEASESVFPAWLWVLIAVVAVLWAAIIIARRKVRSSGSIYKRR